MPEETFPCPRCGSHRFVSISLNQGFTRVPQCVPCGAIHYGYWGHGWASKNHDSEWHPRAGEESV